MRFLLFAFALLSVDPAVAGFATEVREDPMTAWAQAQPDVLQEDAVGPSASVAVEALQLATDARPSDAQNLRVYLADVLGLCSVDDAVTIRDPLHFDRPQARSLRPYRLVLASATDAFEQPEVHDRPDGSGFEPGRPAEG